MRYFEEFTSNTLAGSGNQHVFLNPLEYKERTGRLFYKIFKGGKYRYSLLFSNIVDSTFADGTESHKNMVCDSWYLKRAAVGIAEQCDCVRMADVRDFVPLTFEGKPDKHVGPGEFFSTDPLELSIVDGQYLCVEISFTGREIPYHEESKIPAFVYQNGEWIPSRQMPFPGMTGCDRDVKQRIAFLGDSITQGIGVADNSYEHWNSRVADLLGKDYAYWNLGLGYARAADAASDGAWLFKARQSDLVVLCLGVNDLLQEGCTEEQLKEDLYSIVSKLKKAHVRVLIQTIPPFEYQGARRKIWEHVNDYIRYDLSKSCDGFFDIAPLLSRSNGEPWMPRYGGHPNSEGCALWAKRLYPVLKSVLTHSDDP